MGYLGNPVTITGTQNNKRIAVTATPNQSISTVTGGYNVGQLDVYQNGVKLVNSTDFVASDGNLVTFNTTLTNGDDIEYVVYENFDVADALPQSGGDVGGGLNVSGIVTATAFRVGTGVTINSDGATVIGVVTATTFVGNVTGNASGSSGSCTGDAAGLTGTPNITVGNVTSANVSNSKQVTSEHTNTSGITTSATIIAGAAVTSNADGLVTVGIVTSDTAVRVGAGVTINAAGTLLISDDLTVGGSISVAGTVTSEDTTNVDSTGIVTARGGVKIGAPTGTATTIANDGNIVASGIVTAALSLSVGSGGAPTFTNGTGILIADGTTARLKLADTDSGTAAGDGLEFYATGTDGAAWLYEAGNLLVGTNNAEKLRITSAGAFQMNNGALIERTNVTAGKLSANININLDNGMNHLFTTTETTTCTPNIMSTVGLTTTMATGDTISVNIITTCAAGGYSAAVKIDGVDVTEEWLGGSAPSAGGSSGFDMYNYTIIRKSSTGTINTDYVVLGNLTNFA